LAAARIHLEQGFALYDRQMHKHHAFLYGGHDPGVCCGGHAAEVFWLLGYPDEAKRKSQDAVALARELSHPSSMAHALSFAAWFHQLRGDREAVQSRVQESLSLATEQGFSARQTQTDFLRGWLLVEDGQWQAGLEQMSGPFDRAKNAGALARWHAHCAVLMAEACKTTGKAVDGLNQVDEALARTEQTEAREFEAELHRMKGELLLTQSATDEEEAEACFRKALSVARDQSAKSLELRAAMSMSRLWQKQGKRDEARELLGAIYGWFTEGFDTADLQAAKTLLEDL
jgi:predicted ATPase